MVRPCVPHIIQLTKPLTEISFFIPSGVGGDELVEGLKLCLIGIMPNE